MKALTTITLRGSHKLLRVGSIRSPAALPRMAVRGRAFLSEPADDIRFRYYKGGKGAKRRAHGIVGQARMSCYRRLKIEGGVFFFTLTLADRGTDLLVHRIERLRRA